MSTQFRKFRYALIKAVVKLLSPSFYQNIDTLLFGFPRPFTSFAREHFKGRTDLVGVEVGVFHGKNAEVLLKKLPIKHLYLVDPYKEYTQNNQDVAISQRDFDKASKLLERYPQKTFILYPSLEATNFIPDNLDFVYIDANHSYNAVLEDIGCYFPKLKGDGVIGGHDFSSDWNSVVFAVVQYAMKHNKKLWFNPPDWWMVK